VTAFQANAFAQDAVQLRHNDEGAKVKRLETPPVAHFPPYVKECMRG